MTDVLTEAHNILDKELSVMNITISRQEYEVYQDCVKILESLKAHGVDNWEGFEAAIKEAFSE